MNKHGVQAKRCRQKYLDRGGCAYCGKTRERFKRLCDGCQNKQNVSGLRYVHKTRREAFAHYGGKCACCGEANLGFLTFDHIYNDGGVHREISGCGTGSKFYVWLKRNNYPDDLVQILCWNCNYGKRDNAGVCPHHGIQVRNEAA